MEVLLDQLGRLVGVKPPVGPDLEPDAEPAEGQQPRAAQSEHAAAGGRPRLAACGPPAPATAAAAIGAAELAACRSSPSLEPFDPRPAEQHGAGQPAAQRCCESGALRVFRQRLQAGNENRKCARHGAGWSGHLRPELGRRTLSAAAPPSAGRSAPNRAEPRLQSAAWVARLAGPGAEAMLRAPGQRAAARSGRRPCSRRALRQPPRPTSRCGSCERTGGRTCPFLFHFGNVVRPCRAIGAVENGRGREYSSASVSRPD